MGRGVGPGGDLHANPGPAVAGVVERGDRLGQMKRLGVGRDRGRDEPDVPGDGRHPGRDQHRVQAAADPVGALVAAEPVVGLQVEPVLDRDEVEQAAFRLLDEVHPVGGGEKPLRLRVRFPPGGRVPARVVERDREMQGVHEPTIGSYFTYRQ